MKTIKNIFKSKITYAVLACLLLVGVFAGITTMADDSEPKLTIVAKNINHAESATVLYKVQIDNAPSDVLTTDKLTMKFWTDAPASAADTTPNVVLPYDTTQGDDGKYYAFFESYGFAPKDMTKVIYAAACYTNDKGETVYSNVIRYSVFEYLCEANANPNKTAEQAKLYAAMKDYITYAQKYLNYTAATTPDKIGYITVKHGYFTIDDDPTGTKYTTACIAEGTWYTIKYDYAGLPYREDTLFTYTSIDERIDTVKNGVQSPDLNRTFTISRIVDVNVPVIENTQIVKYRYAYNDKGAPQLKFANGTTLLAEQIIDNTAGGTYKVTERIDKITVRTNHSAAAYHIWGIAADASDKDGNPFSHWEVDGEFYSDDIAIIFNELDVVVNNSADSYDFNAKPVYAKDADAPEYSAETFNISSDNKQDQIVTPLEGNAGFVFDATSKTTVNNSFAYAKATLPTDANLNRFYASYTINLEKHADHDAAADNAARRLLYGLNTNTNFNEVNFYIGSHQAWELILGPDSTCENLGLICRGANNVTFTFSNAPIKFGEDTKIEVYTEVVKEGTTCTLERLYVYVNGQYAGFTEMAHTTTGTFAYNGALSYSILSNNNNKSKVTYSNMKYFGFDPEN